MNIKAGRRKIEISHPDKILFPGDRLTKADLAVYYQNIAQWMMPYIKDRALTLERCPDGVEDGCFMQQEAMAHFPDYVGRAILKRKNGSDLTHVVCNNAATLVYLANMGVVTIHMWLSRIGTPNYPDRMVFDLDPSGNDFASVVKAAALLKELLEETGLISFPMTTGSKGLHILVPLVGQADFDTTRGFARDISSILTSRYPEFLTTEQRIKNRGGRLFLDVQRNAYGQTGVAPFAVRTQRGCPVAATLEWKELLDNHFDIHAQSFTIANILERLDQRGDPWQGMARRARSLRGPRQKLNQLMKNQN